MQFKSLPTADFLSLWRCRYILAARMAATSGKCRAGVDHTRANVPKLETSGRAEWGNNWTERIVYLGMLAFFTPFGYIASCLLTVKMTLFYNKKHWKMNCLSPLDLANACTYIITLVC